MNTNEPFEERLSRQPLRKIPDEWREEILSSARNAALEGGANVNSKSAFAILRDRLAEWLRPAPVAWAGMAACWAVIAALNLTAQDSEAMTMSAVSAPSSAELREALRIKQTLLAELNGQIETTAAEKPKDSMRQPRSGIWAEVRTT